MTKKRVCCFCGQHLKRRNRSKEHVIPQWLLDYLKVSSDDLFRGTHVQFPVTLRSSRIQRARTVLQGNICNSCNNGWMSRLEEASKLIIISMNEGRQFRLLENAIATLSSWIFKTAILINITSNYRRLIPRRIFGEFYETNAVPPEYVIEVAYAPRQPLVSLRWRQCPISLLFCPTNSDKTALSREMNQDSCVVTLQMGHIHTQLVGVPSAKWQCLTSPSKWIHRIWPYQGPLDWPPSTTFSGEIDEFNASPAIRYTGET